MQPKQESHGALFKAKKKSSRSPDYRGWLKIGDDEYWLSGWERMGKLGHDEVHGPYLSLSLTRNDYDK